MYLRKIQLQGFKTFANKTELEFCGNVSCIVGPNGSGKSNIADAVRWVLGEQSIKSLRGAKLEEVIFAGSDIKKPVNFAQVSLVIDNSDNSLPIEYSEVSVTRRVHRSGESEYFINKTPCRLRDIQQLFLNTGLGRDTYSIVGQGEIELIFFSSPTERRAIFEEASGINKYKYKKKEAQRRLQDTSYNLTRMKDIISEISSQIGPLKDAAEKAEKYQKISEELKEIDVGYRIYQAKKLREKNEKARQREESIAQEIQSKQKSLSEVEKRLQEEKEKYFGLEESIEKIQNELPYLAKEIEKIQGMKLVWEERIHYNIKKRQEIEEDIKTQRSRLDLLLNNISHTEENIKAIEEDYCIQKKEVEEYEHKILGQVKILEKEIESLESKKNQAFEKVREQVLKNNQIMQIEKEMGTKKAEIQKLKDSLTEMENTTLSLENEASFLEEEILKTNKNISDIESTRHELLKREEKLNNDVLNIRQERQKISQSLSSSQTRLHTLLQLQYGSSEYALGSKSILSATSLKERGIVGKISSLIKVPKNLERPIEVALGVGVQFIVCKSEEVAKDALLYLKNEKKGRATFILADFFKNYERKKIVLPEIDGIIGWAQDMVEVSDEYKGLIDYLLSNFLVVENLEVGFKILNSSEEDIKIVTKDAEVLFRGTLSGGTHTKEKLGALSIEREIGEEREKISKLKDEFTQKLKEEKNLLRLLDEIKLKIEENNREEDVKKDVLYNLQTTLLLKKDEIKRRRAEYEMLKENVAILEDEIEKLNEMYKNVEKEIEKIKQENDRLQSEILSLQNIVLENQNQRDKILECLTQKKVSFAVMEQKKDNQHRQLCALKEQEKVLKEAILEKEEMLKKYEEEEKTARERIIECETSLAEVETQLKNKQENLNALKNKKSSSYGLQSTEEGNISFLRKEIENLQSTLHHIQVEIAQAETELKEIIGRLQEDYSLSPEEMQFQDETIDVENTLKTIKKLKNSLAMLGPVNLSAISEYKTQKERYDFLNSQFEDITRTYQLIENLIKDMDIKAKYIFLDIFNKVGNSFNNIFQRLFGGGRAKLSLQNYDDIFDSGVEIEVQIPGKKVQNIMLLSGGEKALVAISLLFAFLEIKPSPFCIFDEIDAALDDANIKKFSNLLLEFSKNLQFILITHAKSTMEIADTLYGVTMEEEGISQLVSVKLEDKAPITHASYR